jgi:dTDP-glucose 4,6-dehydratase
VPTSGAIEWHAGDVRNFEFPDGPFSHVLHLATESGPRLSPEASFLTAVHGTERVLDFAADRGVRRLLLTSSGAVYGRQPRTTERMTEEEGGSLFPEDVAAGYAQGKRAAEYLCVAAGRRTSIATTIARCYAFAGPLLPLDANFAVGNFVRDALFGDVIDVKGDGRATRSYMYASDLAVWLWTILLRGESGRPYNVGSENAVTVRDLAHAVAEVVGRRTPVRIAARATGDDVNRYVPSTARARDELGLRSTVELDEAIRRMAAWHLP